MTLLILFITDDTCEIHVPGPVKTTAASDTIKDQTVISAAATKGDAPLIRWTKTHLARVKYKPSLAGVFAV